MDSTQGFSLGTLITVLTIFAGYLIKLNHHRIRSTCCNKICVSSIDVEATTPPEILEIKIPNNIII